MSSSLTPGRPASQTASRCSPTGASSTWRTSSGAPASEPTTSWISPPIELDEHGWPVQYRGVTSVPGLYFMGILFQYSFASMNVYGVGRDAAYVVDRVAERLAAGARVRARSRPQPDLRGLREQRSTCSRGATRRVYGDRERCVLTLTSRPVLLAFVAFVLLAGSNAAAVKAVLGEMPPFWSAGLRFVLAGALLLGLMVIQRRPVPRGQQLLGTVLFGVIAFALPYFFLYQAIGDAGSGTTMTVLAIVPLLTVLLSVVHGIERPRLLGIVGALIAAAGIVIVAANQLSLNVPMLAIALLLVAAVCQAESVVIVKRLPPGNPVAANALGMLLGGSLLIAASLVAGESLALPTQSDTLLGMAYLIGRVRSASSCSRCTCWRAGPPRPRPTRSCCSRSWRSRSERCSSRSRSSRRSCSEGPSWWPASTSARSTDHESWLPSGRPKRQRSPRLPKPDSART